MWNDPGSHGWWWGFGPLPMLLFWVLIIVAIVALGKWIFDHARDFMLNPDQASRPLNYFMYPYAESEGKRIELKPGDPGYTILSRVIERG